MKSIISRIETLEKVQRIIDEKKEKNRIESLPYLYVAPWSMILDEITVAYFPHGRKNGIEWQETLTINEVLEVLNQVDPECYVNVSMGQCIEWMYVFHISRNDPKNKKNRPQYTKEQIDRVMDKWLSDNPELVMLETEEGKELVRVLKTLPQVLCVRACDWINAMNKGDV